MNVTDSTLRYQATVMTDGPAGSIWAMIDAGDGFYFLVRTWHDDAWGRRTVEGTGFDCRQGTVQTRVACTGTSPVGIAEIVRNCKPRRDT